MSNDKSFVDQIFERRRQNILHLIAAYGGMRRFSTVIQRDGAQVSGLVTENEPARNPCGERLARGIEEIVGLPLMWLDEDHGPGPQLVKYVRAESGFGGAELPPAIDWDLVPGMEGRPKPTITREQLKGLI